MQTHVQHYLQFAVVRGVRTFETYIPHDIRSPDSGLGDVTLK